MGEKLQAVMVGHKALEFLGKSAPHVGYVHSVFRSTINIKTRDNELVTITSKNIVSPIHITLRINDPFLNLRKLVIQGSEAILKNANLIVGNIVINLINARIYRNKSLDITSLKIRDLTSSKLMKIIRTYVDLAYICELMDVHVNSVIRNFIKYLINECNTGLSREVMVVHALRNIVKYVGLGKGFTPSMDDFILGMTPILKLLDLNLSGTVVSRDVENSIIRRTSWVSGKMLIYSLRGYIPEFLERLVYALNNSEDLVRHLIDLLSIGHNSGFYMGLGFLTTLSIISDDCTHTLRFLNKIL